MKADDARESDDKKCDGSKFLIFKFYLQVLFFVNSSLLEIYKIYDRGPRMHEGL